MTRRTYLQELRERRRDESERLAAPLVSVVKAMRESVPEIQRSMAELAAAIRRLTT